MADAAAIPVTMTGFSWSTILLIILNLIGGGGLIVAVVKVWPELKKISADREANLLKERGEDVASMREEMKALKAAFEKREAALEVEIRILRHEVGNAEQIIDAMFLLFEAAPSKAADHVKRLKEMRKSMAEAVAKEKGEAMRDKIEGAGS